MGRITVFGTNECAPCMRAKGALLARRIDYVEIDLLEFPERRQDMQSLQSRETYCIIDPGMTFDSCDRSDTFLPKLILIASRRESRWGGNENEFGKKS